MSTDPNKGAVRVPFQVQNWFGPDQRRYKLAAIIGLVFYTSRRFESFLPRTTDARKELLNGKAYDVFRECVKSKQTLGPYGRVLAHFLTHINMSIDEFIGQAQKDPKKAQDLVLGFLLLHKRR